MYGIINRGGRNFSIIKTDIIHKFTIMTLLISTKKSPGGYSGVESYISNVTS